MSKPLEDLIVENDPDTLNKLGIAYYDEVNDDVITNDFLDTISNRLQEEPTPLSELAERFGLNPADYE